MKEKAKVKKEGHGTREVSKGKNVCSFFSIFCIFVSRVCCSTDCARFNSARKGSHFKASTTIPALQFSFNRRVVELQQWFASYQIKALCDDEGNMKIKNTIKNLITLMTIAYYSHNKIIPLIMLLLITGMTNP